MGSVQQVHPRRFGFLVWAIVAILMMRAGCGGPRDCGTIETDIQKLDVALQNNSGSVAQPVSAGASVSANAFAVVVSVRDSVVRTVSGGGACDDVLPRRRVTALSVSVFSDASANKTPLDKQIYVKEAGQLPVLLSSFVKDKTAFYPQSLVLLSFGELPVYGRQRWLIEATLSDGTRMQVFTPYVNLVRG